MPVARRKLSTLPRAAGRPSPRETAAFFLAGTDFYRFDGRTPFTIPATWVLEQAAVALLVGSYAYDDLESRAVQVFVRSGERARWWTCKCAWTFAMAALFHAMVALAATILPASLFAAGSSYLGPEGQMAVLGFALPEAGSPGNVLLFLAPALLSAALSMCQVSLSLATRPTAAFLAVLCYEVASAYSDMPLLVADDAMIARSSFIQAGGYDPCLTIATSAAIFAVAAFIGLAILTRKDLVGKEG